MSHETEAEIRKMNVSWHFKGKDDATWDSLRTFVENLEEQRITSIQLRAVCSCARKEVMPIYWTIIAVLPRPSRTSLE